MAKSAARHDFGGDWTLLKLDAVAKYFSAFTGALKNQNFRLGYIDAFAGTGRCDVKVGGADATTDGSARRALQATPPFDAYCFIERNPRKVAALRALAEEHPDRSVRIVQGDANTALRELCSRLDKNMRAVLFLDPFGLQVDWTTLEAIARTEAIDVWYLFPYSGLYRQAANKAESLSPDKETAITRCLGTDQWKSAFYKPSKQLSFFGPESDVRAASHDEMLDFVSGRLRGIFPAVLPPMILRQSTNAPLFALYFAVSNPAPKAIGLATKIAKDIIDKPQIQAREAHPMCVH